ncbi:MAG TPA: 50S ribosomal protein L11 methyltransferase [Segetibacter sp.]|nr:50S ribosomal protein L11 methyltransferase [Segetibacter sp.]
MKSTIQIAIITNEQSVREELIAQLSGIEYDAFEEKATELCAYIKEEAFEAEILETILSAYNLGYTKSLIENQNWNALWESNFPPVVVDDFCAIRAEFHEPFSNVKNDIIITPKMSFGTGHHATTYMMISKMSRIDFKDKQVADFGTGTGVLAILADKLGSSYVWAVDNDEWSIENSKENIERNGCAKVKIEKAEGFLPKQKFDIILANINKNVILQNAGNFHSALQSEGKLLLSGLLREDEDDVVSAFVRKGLQHISTSEKNNWICILFDNS